ncbi:hypothetical protein VP01_569g6 [Puccinia sorghi]|uniref:Uncharacterized protein n=1 Tax=Puccinia sorghi TaxID=27349 RepID=A0A0L6UIS2_9BASI|nr:hypothetical protein VP01_569g6 [Puccinia sorghi]
MKQVSRCTLRVLILSAWSAGVSALIKGINPFNPPYQTMTGQYGYNQCGTKASPDSRCQNVHIKSASDFCLFGLRSSAYHHLEFGCLLAPRFAGVSETERDAVSYCTQPTHGTRLIPPGTFTLRYYEESYHDVRSLVPLRHHSTMFRLLAEEISQRLMFRRMTMEEKWVGYHLPHKTTLYVNWDARGNPVGEFIILHMPGGVVFGNGNQFVQWTEFLLPDEFCIRACYNGPDAWRYCNHICGCPLVVVFFSLDGPELSHDLMACRWNIPGDYGPGFDSCKGKDVPRPMGECEQTGQWLYLHVASRRRKSSPSWVAGTSLLLLQSSLACTQFNKFSASRNGEEEPVNDLALSIVPWHEGVDIYIMPWLSLWATEKNLEDT